METPIVATKGRASHLFLVALFFLLLIPNASAAVTGFNSVTIKLNLFLLMGGIALSLVFLGAFARSPLLATAGLVTMLFCGLIMLEGGVLVPTGEINTRYVYGTNYTSYHYDDYNGTPSPSLNDLNIFHTNETTVYAAWDDGNNDFIGWVIVIATIVLLFSLVAGLSDD